MMTILLRGLEGETLVMKDIIIFKQQTSLFCVRIILAYNIRLATAQTPSILSNDEWRTFWITWDKHIITFGYGSVPNKNSFLKWRMDRKIKIRQVGFTSMGGSGTEFR